MSVLIVMQESTLQVQVERRLQFALYVRSVVIVQLVDVLHVHYVLLVNMEQQLD